MSLLTAIGLLPLISAGMIALIPTRNNELIKRATLVATTIIAISSIFLAVSFDKNSDQLQFVQKKSWISAFNINFSLGIDGISLVLILLSTILVPIVILATWNESENGRWSSKVFYVLLLTLESLMIGVFAANDLFLFYVFFEANINKPPNKLYNKNFIAAADLLPVPYPPIRK